MTDEDRARLRPELLAAYAEGDVTPSDAAAIERELDRSPGGRRRLAALREIRETLARPVPELERIDLVAGVRARIAAEAAAPTERPRPARWLAARIGWPGTPRLFERLRRLGVVAAAAGAAAAVLVLAARERRDVRDDELRAKSAATSEAESGRWAGVRAFVAAGAAPPRPLGDRLSPGDGLLFSYANLGPRPYAHLMIFAVDARGEVRWLYPAFEHEGTDPTSIAIEGGQPHVPLPELVRHDFAPGPLSLYALFTRRPRHVLEVEDWVRARPGGPSRAEPDGFLQRITTRVGP